MQTTLATHIKDTPQGREAEAILRACVHCGFCTATCPTYQLMGDELDGPRGRIYLIKQALEGNAVSAKTQEHLDRCLTCRSCETTCPSGVRYGRLLDIGRHAVDEKVPRPARARALRAALRKIVPYPQRFALFLKLGHWTRALFPEKLRRKIPPRQSGAAPWPVSRRARFMLAFDGCVQSVATPCTNHAAARVLDRLGISLIRPRGAGCCGAVSQHLAAETEAMNFMRRNIDAWWPHIEAGAEAIVITASGCGAMVKDYGALLRHDPVYAEKAAHVSALAKDVCEVIDADALAPLVRGAQKSTIAFHAPCTLQHGQKLPGRTETLLRKLGFTLTAVPDAHLCCGSAGTYSILQPALSAQLLARKIQSLESGAPARIATANIGCQLHLQSGTTTPVCHWIELVDQSLDDTRAVPGLQSACALEIHPRTGKEHA